MTEAIFGLIGVFVGSAISLFQAYWLNRLDSEKAAKYLAVRVSICLDNYVISCAGCMYEPDPHETPPDRDPMDYTEIPPDLTLPEDIEWRSIDGQLAYQILSLSNEVKRSSQLAVREWQHSDGHGVFQVVCDKFSEIGLIAHKLSSQLKKGYNLEPEKFCRLNDWDPLDILKKRDEERKKRCQKIFEDADQK